MLFTLLIIYIATVYLIGLTLAIELSIKETFSTFILILFFVFSPITVPVIIGVHLSNAFKS